MLSIEECKQILNKKSTKNKKERIYTDSEVEKIRNFLYHLAKIDIESFKESQKKVT